MTCEETKEHAHLLYRSIKQQSDGARVMMQAGFPGAEDLFRGLERQIDAYNRVWGFDKEVRAKERRTRRRAGLQADT